MQGTFSNDRIENLRRFADIACKARPFQEGILQAFQQVFEERMRLSAAFAERQIQLPDFDQAKFSQGISWLAEASLEDFAPLLRKSAKTMLPVLARCFPAGNSFAGVQDLLTGEDFDLAGACRTWLDGNWRPLEEQASHAGLEPAILRFSLEIVLGPVAALAENKVRELLKGHPWQHGYCPVCGQHPSIGFLAKPEKTDLDSLVGGGGQKYLHCSLCAHVWRFRRDACPGCGVSEPGVREMIHAEDARHERIELCHKCRSYHLSVDFREYEKEPDLLIAPVSLMHLDLIARDRGGLPLYAAPWNAA